MKYDEYFKLKDITLNITNNCDLRCDYCFEHNKNKKQLTVENAIKILDKCYHNFEKNNDIKSVMVVNFFGGEPFLNWKVIEHLMKYSKEHKYRIEFGVTTNLTILTDKMIDIIEEYELGMLISIDGIKEIHDRNRCNSYDIVKKNVQKLIDRHLGYLLEARMTLMPKDCDKLLESVKSIVDMGITNIAPVAVTDTSWSDNDYIIYKKSLEEVWEWLINLYNENDNKKNVSIKFIEDYIENVLTIPLEVQMKHCQAGCNTTCSIGVNGDIMPCHQRHTVKKDYDLVKYGNIFDDDIKEINFNQNNTIGAFNCKKCIAYSTCKGGCPSENLTVNGNSNVMNETQCKITQIMVEVALEYQNKILNCKNIRSHRLNVLYQNLDLLNYLINKVLILPKDSFEYQKELVNFYEKMIDMETIILPSFNDAINVIIKDLVNINKEIFQRG